MNRSDRSSSLDDEVFDMESRARPFAGIGNVRQGIFIPDPRSLASQP